MLSVSVSLFRLSVSLRLPTVGGVGWDAEVAGTQCVRLVTAFDTTAAELQAAVTAFEQGLTQPL